MSVYDPHPPKKALTLAQIDAVARREKVKRMLVERLTTAAIAEALGVGARTIERDVAEVRAELAADVSRKDAVSVAGDVLLGSEARQRELWAMYTALGVDAKGKPVKLTPAITSTRVAILRALRDEAEQTVDLLQKLGIVYQAPDNVRIGFAALDTLGRVPEAELQRLASVPVEQFAAELARCVGSDEVLRLLGDDTTAR